MRACLVAWHRALELDPRTKWHDLVRLGQLLNVMGMRRRSVACLRRAMTMPGHAIPPMRFVPRTEAGARGTLVIGFTLFNGVMSGTRFDFWRETGLERHDRLELWDARFQMFLGGLPPLADNYTELLALLEAEVGRRAPRRLILAGCSGSGYAALLYGHALGADAVYAFTPAICVDYERGLQSEPAVAKHFRGLLTEMSALPVPDPDLRDLREVLRRDNARSRYYIHYGAADPINVYRMRFLEGYPNVTLFPHPTDHHMVASWLGKAGQLRGLMAQSEGN